MFDQTMDQRPPVQASEFKQALDQYEGESYREQIGTVVDKVWPAPDYREHQRSAVVNSIYKLYIEDNDVLVLGAPTGLGKSLLLYACASVVDEVMNRKSWTTAPQNTLIEQVKNDDFLDEYVTLMGRPNYDCVHPSDAGTSVDSAICQRDDDFECQYKDMMSIDRGCPYYARKNVAKESAKVFTNLPLLMANSMIPEAVDAGFNQRELLAIDECQSVDDFALMFVGFDVSENSVPIDWDDIPPMPDESASMDEAIEWLQEGVLLEVAKEVDRVQSKKLKSEKEHKKLDRLQKFSARVSKFIDDVREHEWTKTHESYPQEKISFEPVHVGRFLGSYLWSQ
jgi:Rad3-related DNA helicase